MRPAAGLPVIQVTPGASRSFLDRIVGGPLLVIGYLAVLFGAIDQHGPVAGLSALLVAVFEFSLGVWLIVKGFTLRLLPHLSPRTSRPNWTSRRGLSSNGTASGCLLYTSDAADEEDSVDLGGRRII